MWGCIRASVGLVVMAFAAAATAAPAPKAVGAGTEIKALRVSEAAGGLRAVFDLSGPVDYRLFQLAKPDRIVLDFSNARLAEGFRAPAGRGPFKDARTGAHGDGGTRVVLDLGAATQPRSFLLQPAGDQGYRLVVDLDDGSKSAMATLPPEPIGRKVVIAIDPGHGGHDTGAIGYGGLEEKNVTLSVGEDLARLINAQPGMKAVLTRDGDYFVPLQDRYAIARKDKADLFVSIHANACPGDCDAHGASVWMLSTKGASSTAARWLANSENASAELVGGVSLNDKSPTLASVLLDLSQGASMQASHRVARDVLTSLARIGPIYKPQVERANFVVLRSPDVPSILIETAFITDPSDARRLADPAYREKLARAVLGGLKNYFEVTPPPGTWYALNAEKRLRTAAAHDARSERLAAEAGSRIGVPAN